MISKFFKNMAECLGFSVPEPTIQLIKDDEILFIHHSKDLQDPLPYPKVFVLHHRGQPLPAEWKEQVPSNTILIAVKPEHWPGHNCFEARPVSLETLRQEAQSKE